MKYKAFISYKHSENGRRHAVALETALKRYAKPTLSRPMKIFRDEKHMKPDISLPKLIRDGLEDSEFLIFLAEKASAESQWCGEELEYWCGHLQRTDRLIIALIDDDIVLDGTNSIDWEQTTALPRLLQPYLTSIPLYMDLRWAKTDQERNLENKDYHACITPLVARLKHVTPEELTDQELKTYRRNLRLRNWAIGVLLAMLAVSVGATWWAFRQQKIAEEQTLLAKQNEQTANEKTAEAQRNLDRAIAEEERAKQALIQVEKEKNATEVQRREAQKNFENAERERKRAETQLIATKLAMTTKLPENFNALIPLDSLNCSAWLLGSISPEIGKLQNLKWLDLSINDLKSIPPEIGDLHKLQWLSLSLNELSVLPDEIIKLQTLQSLFLSSNELTTLPDKIGDLKNLQWLDIDGNKLSYLPNEFKRLQNLQWLNLSNNLLDSLPNEIGSLQNLQWLVCGENQLNILPSYIGNLQKLEGLFLKENQLSSLPIEIGKLQSLETLNLSQNQLKSGSLDILKQISSLKSVYLTGNLLTKGEVEALRQAMPWCEIVWEE